MASRKKTWAEKMLTGTPKVERIEKGFAGVPAGAQLLISTPLEVDAWIRTNVPAGRTTTVQDIRRDLAEKYGADATCPMTTSIFLRIIAENAWDQLEAGAAIDDVTPFWRAVDPKSPLAKKLRAGPEWIARQREAEAHR